MKSDSNTEPETTPSREVDSVGCAPMPGSQAAFAETIKKLITSFPLSDTPKARKLAVNICTMTVTGPGPLVDMFADGDRRFLMVDLVAKSPENVKSGGTAREPRSDEGREA